MQLHVNERLLIVGPTGTGKTQLALYLLDQVPPNWPVLIIDPKPSKDWIARADRTLRRPADVRSFHGVARVHIDSFDRGVYDPYLEAAWTRARILVVIDELRLLMMHGTTDPLIRILVAGRERQVGCWSLMQRPVKLLEPITEAEWVACFGLQMEKDRDRLGERGASFEGAAQLAPYHYLVHRHGWPQARTMEPVTAGHKRRKHA